MITTDDRNLVRDMVLSILTELSEGTLGDHKDPDPGFKFDNIGLVGVSEFFSDISGAVSFIDSELQSLDYQISTANAYVILASLIQYGIDEGYIRTVGWQDVADRFLVRAQDFAGVRDYMPIGDVWDCEGEWARILNYVVNSWVIKKEDYLRNGEFSNDERVQLIRSTILGFRRKGWLDYNQPWAKRFIAALQEDWIYFGGGFGTGMGSGNNPWSSGG